MRNFKQIFEVLFISSILVFAVSCSDKKESEPTNYTEVVETILELPRKDGSGEMETLKVTFIGTFDEEGNWINKEVSKNVLDYLELDSQLSFENFVEDKIAEKQLERALVARNANSSDSDVDTEINEEGNHAECISGCNDKYTDAQGNKMRGRGACKFHCWVETSVRLVEAIAEIL